MSPQDVIQDVRDIEDGEELDITLRWGGGASDSGMRIIGRENIVAWMGECRSILGLLDDIKCRHDLMEFFGVRFENDFEEIINGLEQAYVACFKILRS